MNQNTYDFNLHDIVGIRLLDAAPADVASVRRQLGPIEGPVTGKPDVLIRFVDRLETPGLRHLGVNDAGFTEDGFFVLRSKHKSPARMKVPLDQVGEQCEIVCERGLPAVPLLIPIINLTALARGALPLHASAFVYKGQGILATGWAKGGKTETLLGFMAHGATYIGDEWVYITPGGEEMFGIPEPIRIWDWQLSEAPHFRRKLRWQQRAKLAGLRPLLRWMGWMGDQDGRLAAGPARLARRLRPLVKKQHGLNVPPERLFGRSRCQLSARLDKVFFVVSQEAEAVRVQPVDPLDVASRMVFSLQEEQMPFLSYYWKYRFAFPGAENKTIECSRVMQEELLRRALANKEAYAVYHPYPVPIPRVFEEMQPFVGQATGR